MLPCQSYTLYQTPQTVQPLIFYYYAFPTSCPKYQNPDNQTFSVNNSVEPTFSQLIENSSASSNKQSDNTDSGLVRESPVSARQNRRSEPRKRGGDPT
jgi:hypothetical protein